MSIAYYSFQAVVQQFNLVPQTTTVPPGGKRFILLGGLIDTIGELSVVLEYFDLVQRHQHSVYCKLLNQLKNMSVHITSGYRWSGAHPAPPPPLLHIDVLK